MNNLEKKKINKITCKKIILRSLKSNNLYLSRLSNKNKSVVIRNDTSITIPDEYLSSKKETPHEYFSCIKQMPYNFMNYIKNKKNQSCLF